MTVRRMLPCVVGMFPFACDGSTAVEGDAGARDAATLDGGSTRDAAPLDAATPDTARVDAAPTPDAGAPDPGFVHAGWCRTSDTALGRVASSLGAGECAELSVDPSLPALGLHGHLTSWSDTGVWNPLTRRVQWVGSLGSCCADPSRHDLLLYDVATDTWSVELTPWPDNVGHTPTTATRPNTHPGTDMSHNQEAIRAVRVDATLAIVLAMNVAERNVRT